jgi:hypothetical protein
MLNSNFMLMADDPGKQFASFEALFQRIFSSYVWLLAADQDNVPSIFYNELLKCVLISF